MKMKTETKKMNITISKEFYDELKQQAKQEHLLVSTYAKQLLMKSLLANNNEENKSLTKNGESM